MNSTFYRVDFRFSRKNILLNTFKEKAYSLSTINHKILPLDLYDNTSLKI